MTEDEKKIAEAIRKCADARLPDDFADRFVRHVCEKESKDESKSVGSVFAHIAILAASVTLLLGFVPNVLETRTEDKSARVARCDEIRAAGHTVPQDSQLNTLALLGFCREAIRRGMKPFVRRFRRREDED